MRHAVPEGANPYLILSGQLSAGKDYVVKQAGYAVYGMADPIYKLTEIAMGTSDKSKEGVREHMQKIGAWGRGECSEKYPLDAERAHYVIQMWQEGHKITGMGTFDLWQCFGKEDFWVQLLQHRIEMAPEEKVAITNGRFPTEINFFTNHGFSHYHVMCTEETRRRRLEASGETYDPDAENDVTEQLAKELNMLAVGQDLPEDAMAHKLSPELLQSVRSGKSVIWNDNAPAPNYELAL